MLFGHVESEANLADICTKPLARPTFERLTKQYLFRLPSLLSGEKQRLKGSSRPETNSLIVAHHRIVSVM